MVEDAIKEKVVVREQLPPMALDNPEQIRRHLKQGELSDKLRGLLREYQKTKRKEVIQKVLSVLGGAFRTLRTKDAAQGIAFMQGLAPKMEGMTPAEKAKAVAPLVKQLSQEEQKRATEYGKLVGKAVDAENDALKSYLNQLGKFASAQGPFEGQKVRAQTAALKQDLERLEGPDKKMTSDTKGIVRSIKSAASANTDNPEDFERHVFDQVEVVLKDDGIEDSQKAALLRNLRPAMPPGNADAILNAHYGEDTEQDDAEMAQERKEIIETFKTNIRTQYGPSVGRFMRDADARLAKASDNTNKAVQQFREKNPMDKVFAPSAAAETAKASIEQIQETPDRAFRSQILKGKISELEEAQPYLKGPDGFKGLLSFYKGREKARRRGEIFKTPAPPSAVYGAETQVAVDEEPDGTEPATV